MIQENLQGPNLESDGRSSSPINFQDQSVASDYNSPDILFQYLQLQKQPSVPDAMTRVSYLNKYKLGKIEEEVDNLLPSAFDKEREAAEMRFQLEKLAAERRGFLPIGDNTINKHQVSG